MTNGSVLADTGYWFGLHDKTDSNRSRAIEIYNLLSPTKILLPWPIMYEVMNTRFLKNKPEFEKFYRQIFRPEFTRIDDAKYRESALRSLEYLCIRKNRNISLVDAIIRKILQDTNVKIDCFVTFNKADFNDIVQHTRTLVLPRD